MWLKQTIVSRKGALGSQYMLSVTVDINILNLIHSRDALSCPATELSAVLQLLM
jgi:hypothetical protein